MRGNRGRKDLAHFGSAFVMISDKQRVYSPGMIPSNARVRLPKTQDPSGSDMSRKYHCLRVESSCTYQNIHWILFSIVALAASFSDLINLTIDDLHIILA